MFALVPYTISPQLSVISRHTAAEQNTRTRCDVTPGPQMFAKWAITPPRRGALKTRANLERLDLYDLEVDAGGERDVDAGEVEVLVAARRVLLERAIRDQAELVARAR